MATNGFKVKNSINLQPGSAPANPIKGDIYCSSADGKFYRYDDSVPGWVELGSGGGAGATVTVSQAGHGFATDGSYIGKPIRNSGVANTYVLAKADTSENAEVVGILTAVADANSFSYSTGGEITGLTGLTPNTVLFLSGDTAGSTTTTAPTTVGYIEKPLLIATAANKAIFVNMRGTTVGGTNLYTTIPLNNGGTTNLQTVNVAAGEGGFIEGVLKIDATADTVTTFKVEFARPITGTTYTCTATYGCDALPSGSSIDITTGGVIQLTLPSINGFSSGSARFSMQAANVGTTLPIQVPSSQITWSEPTMFRNRIINGNFDIWQRGTSQTASGYGSEDRWRNDAVGSTQVHSQQVFTLGQTDVLGNPKYFSRTVVTSVAGSGNYAVKSQQIEDVTVLAGQTVTVSFYAKADAAKNIAIVFNQKFGSGGSPSAEVVYTAGIQTIALSTTWTRYSRTLTLPSIAGKTLGTDANSSSTGLEIWFDAGSTFNSRTNSLGQQSGTFDITGVQLEPGTVATPFEFRPYGTELALCQRYYYKAMGANNTVFGGGLVYSATGALINVTFPVTMRAAPTALEQTTTAANYKLLNTASATVACTSAPTFNSATTLLAVSGFVASTLSGTAGQFSSGLTDGTGYLAWSAELL